MQKVDVGHLRVLAPNNWRFALSGGEFTHQPRRRRASGDTVCGGRDKSKRSGRITMRQKAPHSGPQQAAASGKHIQTLRSACHRKKKRRKVEYKTASGSASRGFYRLDVEKHNVMLLHVCQRHRFQTHYGCCCLIWQIKHLMKPVVFESRDSPFKYLESGNLFWK